MSSAICFTVSCLSSSDPPCGSFCLLLILNRITSLKCGCLNSGPTLNGIHSRQLSPLILFLMPTPFTHTKGWGKFAGGGLINWLTHFYECNWEVCRALESMYLGHFFKAAFNFPLPSTNPTHLIFALERSGRQWELGAISPIFVFLKLFSEIFEGTWGGKCFSRQAEGKFTHLWNF